MKIYSSAFKNGQIDLNYGKFSDSKYTNPNGQNYSFDLSWEIENPNSKFLHLIFVDYDAITAIAKPFVHWTVANIDLSKIENLPINASFTMKEEINQGFNSCMGLHNHSDNELITNIDEIQKENNWKNFNCFVGCFPPNKEHIYTLHVFTTNEKILLDSPFSPNELFHVLHDDNKIIEKAILKGLYPAKR